MQETTGYQLQSILVQLTEGKLSAKDDMGTISISHNCCLSAFYQAAYSTQTVKFVPRDVTNE